MKNVGKGFFMGASLALAFGASTANAALIDFSSASWSGADGQGTYSVAGVTATANPSNARLSHDSSHGLGINYWDCCNGKDDEIDNTEQLSIDFGVSTQIEEVVLHNFFADEGWWHTYDEQGKYRLDGGSWQSFTASATVDPGMFTISVGSWATTLDFKADRLFKDDYSLKSIKTAEVPEPGTLALLALGLLGLGVKRRHQLF